MSARELIIYLATAALAVTYIITVSEQQFLDELRADIAKKECRK